MKVYVAGHTGLVGRATVKALEAAGHIPWTIEPRYDLSDQRQARRALQEASKNEVDAVVLAAARVGGIGANSKFPVEFLYYNVAISINVIREAFEAGIPKFVNLGSSCIYPRKARQPMREEVLMSGPLEPTNEGYAVAKITALKFVQAYRREYGARYISLMPTNLYGEGDTYDFERSHVIPSLIMKFEAARLAKQPYVELWGTGTPLREFLHVDDLARAIVLSLESYDDDLWLNVGSDTEITIRAVAALIGELTGYHGEIRWNTDRPDGTPRKRLDWSRLRALGWKPEIGLWEGLRRSIEDYRFRYIFNKAGG